MAVSEMRAMTWWQFNETIDGWMQANSQGKDESLSEVEEESLWALVNSG